MRENRWAQERFGCNPINPVACQNCQLVIGSYRSAHCQVYPEQGGRLKPDDVYYWVSPARISSPLLSLRSLKCGPCVPSVVHGLDGPCRKRSVSRWLRLVARGGA